MSISAGPAWRYRDPKTGSAIGRSEGLGLASHAMFAAGAFSADPRDPLRADAEVLANFSVAELERDGEWRELVPGMVLTVEPGCYIRPGAGVPEAYAGIGVRIEDDALVTSAGCEIITEAAPKAVPDIEALMRGS